MSIEVNISGRKVAAGVALGLLMLYGVAGLNNIELGEAGIAVQMIGTDRGSTSELGAGTRWVEPFANDVFIYDARAKQYDENLRGIEAETKDGQPITVDVSFQISLLPSMISILHETVGENYYDEIVFPAARKLIRQNTSSVLSDVIYTGTGKRKVSDGIESDFDYLSKEKGIVISVNLRNVEFTNPDYVATLEQKAIATQKEIIEKRLAAAAIETAKRVVNQAEGEKQKTIKEAEANAERQRLEGLGQRQKDEERALGILAVKKSEAEGTRLQVLAYGSGNSYAQVKVAEALGDNFQIWGIPTGAPGTSSFIGLDAIMGKAVMGGTTGK